MIFWSQELGWTYYQHLEHQADLDQDIKQLLNPQWKKKHKIIKIKIQKSVYYGMVTLFSVETWQPTYVLLSQDPGDHQTISIWTCGIACHFMTLICCFLIHFLTSSPMITIIFWQVCVERSETTTKSQPMSKSKLWWSWPLSLL